MTKTTSQKNLELVKIKERHATTRSISKTTRWLGLGYLGYEGILAILASPADKLGLLARIAEALGLGTKFGFVVVAVIVLLAIVSNLLYSRDVRKRTEAIERENDSSRQ